MDDNSPTESEPRLRKELREEHGIRWRDVFTSLYQGRTSDPFAPKRRAQIVTHLRNRDFGPRTREAIETCIDEAIEAGILGEVDGGRALVPQDRMMYRIPFNEGEIRIVECQS